MSKIHVQQLTKVIIADDQLLFADGLEEIINKMPDFEVTGKAANGKQLLQILNSLCPDLILLDIQMPFLDGFETAILIKKNQPGLKIVFISLEYNQTVKSFISKNDIEGFIIKSVGAPELKEAIINVMLGNKILVLPQQFSTDFTYEFGETDFFKKYKITKTEREIIELIALGNSSKVIADKRKLSTLTVESHRKNIFRKLKAKNVAEVIAFAVKNGLVK